MNAASLCKSAVFLTRVNPSLEDAVIRMIVVVPELKKPNTTYRGTKLLPALSFASEIGHRYCSRIDAHNRLT